MATKRVTLNRFDGGKAQSMRASSQFGNEHYTAKQFDTQTDPHKLSPLVGMENAIGSLSPAFGLKSFVNLEYTPGTSRIFALGNETSQSYWRLFMEQGTSPFSWGTLTMGVGTTGTVIPNSLISCSSVGIGQLLGIYISGTTVTIFKYVPSTTTKSEPGTIVSVGATYTGFVYAQPYFFPNEGSDGVIYFGVGNKLGKYDVNSGGFTDLSTSSTIFVPSGYIITSLTKYQNYLAIGCRATDFSQPSKVFLWDRDASNTLFAEAIDWGDGQLNVLENIDGSLVGVSEVNGTLYRHNPRLVVKSWNGGQPKIEKEITGLSSAAGSLKNLKSVANGKVYFVANLSSQLMTYCIGKNALGSFFITEASFANNNTTVTSIDGLSVINDTFFIAYNGAGAVNSTDDNGSYALVTAVYETTLNPKMPDEDRFQPKSLLAMDFSCPPLPSGASIVMSYAVDGGSYTACQTYSTVGGTGTQFACDASTLPFSSGTEYQFKLECTGTASGKAEVTEIGYKYTTTPSLV